MAKGLLLTNYLLTAFLPYLYSLLIYNCRRPSTPASALPQSRARASAAFLTCKEERRKSEDR